MTTFYPACNCGLRRCGRVSLARKNSFLLGVAWGAFTVGAAILWMLAPILATAF